MDVLSKLSREAQVVLGGGVLLLILSFFHWQQVSATVFGYHVSGGLNEWHGFVGVLACLLVVAMLVWEVLRLMGSSLSLGTLDSGLVSLGLALLVGLFTLIAFFDKSDARNWPAWIGLLVALVVAAAAVMRARAEGVQMPQGMAAGSAGSAAPPAAPAEPVAPAEPTDEASE